MKRRIKKLFALEVDGIGVVEIILILVVLIGLVLIFRTQITSVINSIFTKITDAINGF